MNVKGHGRLALSIAPKSDDRRLFGFTTALDGSLFAWDNRSHIEQHILYFGGHDWPIFLASQRLLEVGDIVFDIGANIGALTIPFARLVGPSGRVVAFEPVEHLRKRLSDNIRLNSLTNIDVQATAVGRHSTEAILYVPDTSSSNQGVASLTPANGLEPQVDTVSVLTLDDIHKKHAYGTPRLIKVDIEGHELDALSGAVGLIQRALPHIIFEYEPVCWKRAGHNWSDIAALLGDIGPYSLYRLGVDGLSRMVYDGSRANVLATVQDQID